MDIKNIPNHASKFTCNTCAFNCSKRSNFDIHLTTAKHIKSLAGYKKDMEHVPKNADKNEHVCSCGKKYNYQSGLWRHKKKCIKPVPKSIYKKEETCVVVETSTDLNSLTLLVVELLKSNQELQKQMLEVCKNSSSTINNTHNSNNKTFNMQFFLNEQCKDAMNIMDFVDTFKLEFSDLERVGEVGYVEGISGIIIKKLNEMDIYKRPIHCSDAKRETMFVKDKNVWEKENGNHDKLRLAIRHITKKNTDMLLSWCNAHPGSCDSDNYLNDLYIEIVRQAMGAGNIEENENKIMRKIARTVLIDKDM